MKGKIKIYFKNISICEYKNVDLIPLNNNKLSMSLKNKIIIFIIPIIITVIIFILKNTN